MDLRQDEFPPFCIMEQKYEFRRRLLEVHKKNIGAAATEARPGYCLITEDWEIVLPKDSSRLLTYLGRDLRDFFEVSLGMALRIRYEDNGRRPQTIRFLVDDTLDTDMPLAYRISVTDACITVWGKSERGTAQGGYLLEDEMRIQAGPYVSLMEKVVTPMFSPRMTHSGYGMDMFPDAYLAQIAHAGMDAILVYASGLYKNHCGFPDPDALWPGTCQGFCDFNELVYRAAGFGLDVYVYSHYICDMHPDEPGAVAYYKERFGAFFQEFPGVKGIVFVGETFEFPSRDPHTTGKRYQLRQPEDKGYNVGWYPCQDYPQLVTLVRDVIREHAPAADVVFWSYNWGFQPVEERLRLIRDLPRDISLLVTYDMFERFYAPEEDTDYGIADYSISFTGPGHYFLTEAEEAKRLGIRLYAMVNTGGRTWDMGLAPYLPFPDQWAARVEKLAQSHDTYGLAGLMESHHFGWVPSFVSDLVKYGYSFHGEGLPAHIEALAKRDFGEAAALARDAWAAYSEAIRCIVPSDLDQYGPFRVGPTYPLVYNQTAVEMPSVPYGQHSGNAICFPIYRQDVLGDSKSALLTLHRTEKAVALLESGNAKLTEAVDALSGTRLEDGIRLLALCRFMENTYRTAVHVKRWTLLKALLPVAKVGKLADYPALYGEILPLLRETANSQPTPCDLRDAMVDVAEAEIANANATVPLCETDSMIGYEPSMEYMCSRTHIQWKIDVVRESVARLLADWS